MENPQAAGYKFLLQKQAGGIRSLHGSNVPGASNPDWKIGGEQALTAGGDLLASAVQVIRDLVLPFSYADAKPGAPPGGGPMALAESPYLSDQFFVQSGGNGYFMSPDPLSGMSYVRGDVLGFMWAWGDHVQIYEDRAGWRRMALRRAWKWQTADSIALTREALRLIKDELPRRAYHARSQFEKKVEAERIAAAEQLVETARPVGHLAHEIAARLAFSGWPARNVQPALTAWMYERVRGLEEILAGTEHERWEDPAVVADSERRAHLSVLPTKPRRRRKGSRRREEVAV